MKAMTVGIFNVTLEWRAGSMERGVSLGVCVCGGVDQSPWGRV